MISRSQIEELRDRWQTTELNVAREYVQHVLLSSLFRGMRRQIKLAFKGGTALRLVWGSPRFSEDLDFTGWGKEFHVGESLKETMIEASRAGLDIELVESNKTSGGWFALARTRVHDWPVEIEWNVSLREAGREKTDAALITTPLWASYSASVLPADRMVSEKVSALLRRKKPRDFFDLYFLLRERRGLKAIVSVKKRLLTEVEKLDPHSLKRELKDFLPMSAHPVLNNLPQTLKAELERL